MPGEASDKGPVRKEMRRILDSLSEATKNEASVSIVEQLSHLLPAHARCAVFHGTSREPHLSSLFEKRPDLTLAYPRVIAPGTMAFYHTTCLSSLKPGSFGILEPDPSFPLMAPSELDAIICPGLAFTQEGHRLGQGGGFYDRYLATAGEVETIGVAFSEQILNELPQEEHDLIMGDLLTPQE